MFCLLVCLSVCLYICLSVFGPIFETLYVRSSSNFRCFLQGPTHSDIITHSGRDYMTLFWRRCGYTLYTSGFMDDVIFAQLRPVGLPYLDGPVAEWLACWTLAQIEGPGFKSKPRRCRLTVLGKLSTPIVPLFTKKQNW